MFYNLISLKNTDLILYYAFFFSSWKHPQKMSITVTYFPDADGEIS